MKTTHLFQWMNYYLSIAISSEQSLILDVIMAHFLYLLFCDVLVLAMIEFGQLYQLKPLRWSSHKEDKTCIEFP